MRSHGRGVHVWERMLFFEDRKDLKVNDIFQWPSAILHFDAFEIWK